MREGGESGVVPGAPAMNLVELPGDAARRAQLSERPGKRIGGRDALRLELVDAVLDVPFQLGKNLGRLGSRQVQLPAEIREIPLLGDAMSSRTSNVY